MARSQLQSTIPLWVNGSSPSASGPPADTRMSSTTSTASYARRGRRRQALLPVPPAPLRQETVRRHPQRRTVIGKRALFSAAVPERRPASLDGRSAGHLLKEVIPGAGVPRRQRTAELAHGPRGHMVNPAMPTGAPSRRCWRRSTSGRPASAARRWARRPGRRWHRLAA